MKEPIGLLGSLSPALALNTASATKSTASSCPITLLWRRLGRCSSFSLSLSTSFVTGIPVHFDIISAISSSVTSSFNSWALLFAWFSLSLSSFFSSSGSFPCFSIASSSKSYLLSASSILCLVCSISFCRSFIFIIFSFSSSHWLFIELYCSFKIASSFWRSSSLVFDDVSVSFLSACCSISICMIFLLIASSSVGMLSISVLIIEAASSIRSIALSGRNLSEMYLFDSTAQAIIALSVILTPWWISNFSFIPLNMDMVSSTSGWSTRTGWNLLSRAASFSIYLRYSSKVVAPIQWSSPLASIGFRRFPASIAPSVLPAPTIVWSSSINKIICPSDFETSFSTALSLSSNSPLYFAPAMRAPISSANIVLSFKPSGTSWFTILWASPSTTAVLPTPGSPISTGLFLVLLDRILIALLISSSLPITGSSLPFLAISTKSLPYLFRTS